MHFSCEPHTANADIEPLEFEWDEATGAVSGPGAQTLRALVRRGEVEAGPHPRCSWSVDEHSLTSHEGLALLVGHAWVLPPELAGAYPDTTDTDIPERSYTDPNGVYVVGRDMLLF